MIETKDLRLRKAVFKDWRDMYERVWRHSETAKYMLWTVTDNEDDAKDRMERTIAYQRKNPCGYIVCEKSSDRPIGFAGMIEIEPEVWEDTGIALGPEFTGKGYGQQVLMGLVDEAFRQWGARKFICSCRSENDASRRMQLACGFTFSHTEDRVDPRNDTPYVLEFYELISK